MTKQRLKRNCENCKAMEYDSYSYHCLLGFKTECIYGKGFFGSTEVISLKPLEICPKPLNNRDLTRIIIDKRNQDE